MSTYDDGDVGRVLMVVPTYNERDNVEWIVGRLRAANPAVDVLVVDDGSPDGTGELADALAACDPQVTVPSGEPSSTTSTSTAGLAARSRPTIHSTLSRSL